MVQIATTVCFEAAHRQYRDDSKCGRLHGHNWRVDFVLQGDNVNPVGYLVNFSSLDDLVSPILDHSTILHKEDPLGEILIENGQKVAYMEVGNPTCENLAKMICTWVVSPLSAQMEFIGVTVWENDCSRATIVWTPEEGYR